jgi:hypothetical protein
MNVRPAYLELERDGQSRPWTIWLGYADQGPLGAFDTWGEALVFASERRLSLPLPEEGPSASRGLPF